MTIESKSRSASFGLLAGAAFAILAGAPMSANAVIHEIVAAFCSGGGKGVINANGELRPPPLTRVGTHTFARPVIASGAVDVVTLTTTSKPNSKFPEGTSVFAATPSASNHPSAAHCRNVADLP